MATTPVTFPAFPSATTYPPPIFPGSYYYYPPPPPFPYNFSSCPAPPPGFFPALAYALPPVPAYVPALPAPAYGHSTFPSASTSYPPEFGSFLSESSCPTHVATPIPTNLEPNWPPPTPVSDWLLPSAPIKTILTPKPSTTLPSIPASKVTSGGAPAGHTVMELHPYEVPCTAENARPLCTGEKGVGKSCSVVHPTTPDIMCQGGDLPKGNGAGGESISDKKLVDKHTGLGSLSISNAGPDHGFVTLQATTAPTPSFGFGLTSTPAASGTSTGSAVFGSTVSAPLFSNATVSSSITTATMTVPLLGGTSTLNTTSPVLSSAPSMSTSTAAYVTPQLFGEMPQSYGFSNLHRQSILLADGTERSYYALPENYPLELVTPPMSPVVGIGCVTTPSVAAQVASLAPVLCPKVNITAGSESLLVPNLQRPMNVHCHDDRPDHIICTNSPETVQLNFEQEDILISGVVSTIVNPEAREIVAPPSHCINHATLRLLWDPGTTKFPILFHTAAGATELQGTYVSKSAMVHILAVQLGARRAPIFKYAIMRSDASGLGWTALHASVLLVLFVPCSTGKSSCLSSFEMANLQWDPGIALSSYRCSWLVRDRNRCKTGKALVWLQSPLFSDLQNQLQRSNTFSVWDPGIWHLMDMMLGNTAVPNLFPSGLHIHRIPLADCSTLLSPTQITDSGSSKVEVDELTSPGVVLHLQQSTKWTSTSPNGIASSEYAYTLDFIIHQWELHKQGVQKNYNANNLLSSQKYLQILEMDIIFITYLPP